MKQKDFDVSELLDILEAENEVVSVNDLPDAMNQMNDSMDVNDLPGVAAGYMDEVEIMDDLFYAEEENLCITDFPEDSVPVNDVDLIEDLEEDEYEDGFGLQCYSDYPSEYTEEDAWDALTDGMYGDYPGGDALDSIYDMMGL